LDDSCFAAAAAAATALVGGAAALLYKMDNVDHGSKANSADIRHHAATLFNQMEMA
jgi:hypothetical protein